MCVCVTLLFVPGGQTICLSPGEQIFIIHSRGGGQTFFVVGGGGRDEVDEEIDMS